MTKAKNEAFEAKSENTLTPKQLVLIKQRDDITQLVIEGFSLEKIASMLGISPATVDRRIAERREENLKEYAVHDKQKRIEKIAQMMAKYRLMERKLWEIHASTDSDQCKLAAIIGVLEVDERWIKVQQMLGFLPKDGTNFEDTRNVTVIFKNMPRPDRSEYLAQQAENEKRLQESLQK